MNERSSGGLAALVAVLVVVCAVKFPDAATALWDKSKGNIAAALHLLGDAAKGLRQLAEDLRHDDGVEQSPTSSGVIRIPTEVDRFLGQYAAMIEGKSLSPEAPRVDPTALDLGARTRSVTFALDGPQSLTLV